MSKLWIDVVEAMRMPSGVRIMARSMPASSRFSMERKSPTLCVTGFKTNTHGSLRDGRGTVTWGKPFWISMVTLGGLEDTGAADGLVSLLGDVGTLPLVEVWVRGHAKEKLRAGKALGKGFVTRKETSRSRARIDQIGMT